MLRAIRAYIALIILTYCAGVLVSCASEAEDGLSREYFQNGAVKAEGRVQGNSREGPWKWWYPDGALAATGRYEYGKLDGPYITYKKGGGVDEVCVYDGGILHGPNVRTVGSTGEYIIRHYWNGEPLGLSIWLRRNGRLKSIGTEAGSVRRGVWSYWSKDGYLESWKSFG